MASILIEQLPAHRRSLRLAVVTETYPPEVNGVALSLARFVDGLRECNHDIQLIRPRQSFGEQPDQRTGFNELLTQGMPIPRYPDLKMGLPAKQALIKQWTLRRPDLVHIVTEGPLGWSALQAAHKLKIPLCSDFRTNFHAYSRHYGIGWLKKPIVAYLRKFHNRTQLTMVPTEQLRGELEASGFRNLKVVARGVDTQLFNPLRRSQVLRSEWGAKAETLVVMHVGRLAAEKNLSTLITAFLAIRQHQPEARLVFVGDGPEKKHLRQQLPDAIFAGTRRGEDLAAHYASGDLFLFPSITETFGNVTLEAMASGLPMVAFDYAAAAEHLRHQSSGLLAAYDQTDQFTACAQSLAATRINDPQAFAAMGSAARLKAESLDWKCVVKQMESILLTVAASHQDGERLLPRQSRIATPSPDAQIS